LHAREPTWSKTHAKAQALSNWRTPTYQNKIAQAQAQRCLACFVSMQDLHISIVHKFEFY